MPDLLDTVAARISGSEQDVFRSYESAVSDADAWERGIAQRFWALALLCGSPQAVVKAVESAVLAHGVAVTGSDRLAELAVALAAAWSDEDGDTFARVDRAAGSTGESALAVLGFLDLAIMDLAYERRPGDVLGVIREAARQAQPGLFDEPIDRH